MTRSTTKQLRAVASEELVEQTIPASIPAVNGLTVEVSRDLAPAISYLRVSTKEQAQKGGQDEGFSIPAQRQANAHKAEAIGARIGAEFVEPASRPRAPTAPSCNA